MRCGGIQAPARFAALWAPIRASGGVGITRATNAAPSPFQNVFEHPASGGQVALGQ